MNTCMQTLSLWTPPEDWAPADLEILEIAYRLTHNTGKSWKIRKFRKMYEYQDLNPDGQRPTGPSYHWTTSTIANSNRSWNLKEDLKDFWCRHQSLNPANPDSKKNPANPDGHATQTVGTQLHGTSGIQMLLLPWTPIWKPIKHKHTIIKQKHQDRARIHPSR
jgi:hypothetical protein